MYESITESLFLRAPGPRTKYFERLFWHSINIINILVNFLVTGLYYQPGESVYRLSGLTLIPERSAIVEGGTKENKKKKKAIELMF